MIYAQDTSSTNGKLVNDKRTFCPSVFYNLYTHGLFHNWKATFQLWGQWNNISFSRGSIDRLYGDKQLCDKLQVKVSDRLSCGEWHFHCRLELIKPKKETYVDDAFFVPHQQIPEKPSLVQIPQPNHVIHTFHRRGVHGLEGNLLTDLVLLRTSYHRINMTSSERNNT